MCHLELSLWVGGVGVQRGDWGANGGESRLCRPGRGPPRLPAGPRARSAGAPGSCAPLPGSRPRLRGCGLVVSGREAGERRASVPPAGARARGAGQARSRRAGELRGAGPRRCTSGASGGRRAASARGAWGKAAQEAVGLFSPFPYFITQRGRNGEWGAVGLTGAGAKRGHGACTRRVALTASLLPLALNPPPGPFSSLPPSQPLPPPVAPWRVPGKEREAREAGEGRTDWPRSGWRIGARRPVNDCRRRARAGALSTQEFAGLRPQTGPGCRGGWGTRWGAPKPQDNESCARNFWEALFAISGGCWSVLRAWPFISYECVCVCVFRIPPTPCCLYSTPSFLVCFFPSLFHKVPPHQPAPSTVLQTKYAFTVVNSFKAQGKSS